MLTTSSVPHVITLA